MAEAFGFKWILEYSVLLTFFLAVSAVRVDLTMPSLFADHMVLQQGMDLPVWGWADPGEKVVVEFAGQKAQATADADGNWKTVLKPVVSKNPLTMTITGKNTVTIQDILMGEVWVCSGQSNMGVVLSEGFDAEKDIAAANYPKIRHFQMDRVICPEPNRKLGGKWEVCSPPRSQLFV